MYPKQIRDRLFGIGEMIGAGVGLTSSAATTTTDETESNTNKSPERKHSRRNKKSSDEPNSLHPTKQRLKTFINEDGASGQTQATASGDPLESKPM